MVQTESTIKYLPKLSLYSIGASCIMVLLVFVLLSQYSHPAADDFCVEATSTWEADSDTCGIITLNGVVDMRVIPYMRRTPSFWFI